MKCYKQMSTNLEKSQDFIFLEGLFPSSISKTLQQWKYDLQDMFTKLKNDWSP